MKRILHLKTRSEDELAATIYQTDIAASAEVIVMDLTKQDVDYQKLLEAIFMAEVVQSW
jgi:hypothetical protein